MQLYAVNFIPLLSSLYMFWAPHTHPSSGVQCSTVSTATGTNHSIDTDRHSYFLPVWPGTYYCTPDDGRVWRPKHVE